MSGFALENAAALRAVDVTTDPPPKLRWLNARGIWYQLLPAAGGETDDGDLIIAPTTQPASGDVFWHKGVIGETIIASSSSSPVGSITPGKADIPYHQIASDRVVHWISIGATSADWRAIGGTAIQQENNPNEAPAFPGQVWQNVTIDTAGGVTVNNNWIGIDIGGSPDTSSWYEFQ